MMTKYFSLPIFAVLGLTACSSQNGHLLPDGGPTPQEIMSGDYLNDNHKTVSRPNARYINNYLIEDTVEIVDVPSMSTITSSHLNELNQDFKSVPNPQLIGYIYPHFNSSGMPVPGYFTTFRLYKQNHYALREEGSAEGFTP
ncbi:TIGR03751 family conjugal transfer lipoprotein [Suttonella ornithocola]|uniref:Conjugative transfer region lipoprotein n=1 Tax=Suttonella ornithocola TaxID=279832 RepID=A0A380MWM2_9GAMM|nr:TIGR03751 family conjugal transfer lipoprotein [Suttonella ornithocola]SUO96678.1 conjugative transfer region lipoprotein [Suttonella ornithocola]